MADGALMSLSMGSEEYDRHHSYRDSNGEVMKPPTASYTAGSSIRNGNAEEEKEDDEDNDLLTRRTSNLPSVFLATGIHHQLSETDFEDLPRRFESGSTKASISWFGALCMAGIGMFIEAYIIITTGQIKTLWHDAYPACFMSSHDQVCPNNIECCGLFPNTPMNDTSGECAVDFTMSGFCDPTTTEYYDGVLCNQGILGSISYSEFAGLMIGMISFGSIADLVGINNAGIVTMILGVTGVSVMTFIDIPDNLNLQFLIYSIFFGIYGLGVGGEYPLTAAGAAAHHHNVMEEASMDDAERHVWRILRDKERTARRGETIGIVFAMQGIGAVTGSLFVVILIHFARQGNTICDRSIEPGVNSAGVNPYALDSVWRAFLFIGLIFNVMILLYRWLIVVESEEGAKKIQKRKANRSAATKKLNLWTIFGFYGTRVIATGGCWFIWDIAFYGLKLFSGPIFEAINPDGGLMANNGYLLINNILNLIGYYGCSMIIDKPKIGRVKVQAFFFTVVSIVFLMMSVLFTSLSSTGLIALFYLSGILGQFVNVTTYVMAAETYPAELRGTLHGISAFLGKSGALIATIAFGYVTTEQIFLICGITGLIGALVTICFSVDMTGVSLSEHDAQLELFLEGRLDEYKGKLNKPDHLSLFERVTGRHGEYDPQWARKFVIKEKTKHGISEQSFEHEEEQAM